MTEMEKRKGSRGRRGGLLLMILGALLVFGAAGLTGWNLYEGEQAGKASASALDQLRSAMPETTLARSSVASYIAHAQSQNPLIEVSEDAEISDQVVIPLYLLDPTIPMPKLLADGRLYIGTLNIPVLGLDLPVLDDCTTSGMKKSPCRWSGSAYTDDLVICAHNYPRLFGTLKSLNPDDLVTFTDADGNLFSYRVAGIEIHDPEDVDEVENSEYDLTLYTCTVGGKTRVTVRCVRERE